MEKNISRAVRKHARWFSHHHPPSSLAVITPSIILACALKNKKNSIYTGIDLIPCRLVPCEGTTMSGATLTTTIIKMVLVLRVQQLSY